ncbi:MAG: energy transducer TonB [Bacteroidaceae bacterium]|nr:energy transducer TonB [Bacteroidaceae bacterium]
MLNDGDYIDSLANDSAAYAEVADSLDADGASDLLATTQTTSTDKKAEEEAKKKAEEEAKKKAEEEAKKKAEEEARKKAEEEARKKAEEEARKKAEESKPTEQSKPVVEAQTSNDDNNVFDVPEVVASFPGGDSALSSFLSKNVRYPAVAAENGIQGRVIVKFIIEKDGSISNAQVLKSVDPSLDKEALRVINSMPKWTPGRQNDKPVRASFTLPINFKLQ